jgi:hypothetical protein
VAFLRRIVLAILWLSSCVVGCATGSDEPGGGGFNLPHIDALPVSMPDDPVVYSQEKTTLSRPWAVVTDAGIQLWFGAKNAEGEWIASSHGESFNAQEPWEDGRVREPCVVGNWLVYGAGDNAGIGLAERVDGQWLRRSDPILAPEQDWESGMLAHPSLLVEKDLGRTLLFYVAGENRAAIGVAASDMDAVVFERLSQTPVFEPQPWNDTTFLPLSGASAYLSLSPLGRPIYGIYYSRQGAIGYAAGFEPTQFDELQVNPLLEQSGYNLEGPMRAGDYLFHSRNLKQYNPSKGRVIGAATFSKVLSLDLFIE